MSRFNFRPTIGAADTGGFNQAAAILQQGRNAGLDRQLENEQLLASIVNQTEQQRLQGTDQATRISELQQQGQLGLAQLASELETVAAQLTQRRQQAQDDRQFQAGQNQLDRRFRAGQAQTGRQFQAEQGQLDRRFRAGQAQTGREFEAEQGQLDREFRAGQTQEKLQQERKLFDEEQRLRINLARQGNEAALERIEREFENQIERDENLFEQEIETIRQEGELRKEITELRINRELPEEAAGRINSVLNDESLSSQEKLVALARAFVLSDNPNEKDVLQKSSLIPVLEGLTEGIDQQDVSLFERFAFNLNRFFVDSFARPEAETGAFEAVALTSELKNILPDKVQEEMLTARRELDKIGLTGERIGEEARKKREKILSDLYRTLNQFIVSDSVDEGDI